MAAFSYTADDDDDDEETFYESTIFRYSDVFIRR